MVFDSVLLCVPFFTFRAVKRGRALPNSSKVDLIQATALHSLLGSSRDVEEISEKMLLRASNATRHTWLAVPSLLLASMPYRPIKKA